MDKPVILLVEDNPAGEMLILRAFKMSNQAFHTAVARDGAEALDYLFARGRFAGRRPQEFPVMVLLDLKLPEIDGLEVLRRIRRDPRTQSLPVVIFTTSDNEQDVVEAYRLGANSYVRKPATLGALNQAIADIGHYWGSVNLPLPG